MKSTVLLCVALSSALAVAQVSSGDPALQSTPFASGINGNGFFTSMAADAQGFVYVVTKSQVPVSPTSNIHRVDAAGNFLNGFLLSNISQLARRPADGRVFMLEYAPSSPFLNSVLCRLESDGNVTFFASLGLRADSLAITSGDILFAGGFGPLGQGIYQASFATPSFLTLVHPGVGSNTQLRALPNGDLLVADGADVWQITPNVPGATLVYSAPATTGAPTVRSMAANPFNHLGLDTLFLHDENLGMTGGSAGLVAASASMTDLVTDTWTNNEGSRLFAEGLRGEGYLLRHTGNAAVMEKIVEIPTLGNKGSLIYTVGGGLVSATLDGPPGAAFVLGLGFAGFPPPPLYVPGFGIIDLSPLHFLYLVAIDGAGLLGPANPAGVLPPSGTFAASVPFGPLGSPLSFQVQALVADAAAPNGLFLVSNVASFTLP